MNLQTTISFVAAGTIRSTGKLGPVDYINGLFADGIRWSYGAKPDESVAVHAALTALIGKPGSFEVNPRPDYNGQRQCFLKTWPGKPQSVGRAAFVPRYRDTPEGAAAERDAIHRSVALTQAVAWCAKDGDWEILLANADRFYAWLTQRAAKPQFLTPPLANKPPPISDADPWEMGG